MSEQGSRHAVRRVVLTCGGASNVGQIANEAAKRLDAEGLATYFCLAGIATAAPFMLEAAKAADQLLVLEGCPLMCAAKLLREAGIHECRHVNVAEELGCEHVTITDELGIGKEHRFDLDETQIEALVRLCKKKLGIE